MIFSGDQATTSGYGIGNYSAFYSNYDCWGQNQEINNLTFSPSQTGDVLYFEYAYAPYGELPDPFTYDDLEVFYSADYYSLEYITGEILQTAPGTSNAYFPAANEWGTYVIILPVPGITNIRFRSIEECGNNIYIDNIKVGAPAPGNDAAVKKVWAKGKLALGYGVPDTISVLIENLGAAATNIKVDLKITGINIFADSVTIMIYY